MTAIDNPTDFESWGAGRLQHFEADGVRLSTDLLVGATLVVAMGQLDATNLHHLTDHVHRSMYGDRPLVLDLSELDFLAVQGIETLLDLDAICQSKSIQWALLTSHPVAKLLRIDGRATQLPVVSSIDQALDSFSWPPAGFPSLLQLVT